MKSEKFKKPYLLVWFDPRVKNNENKSYLPILKEKLKIEVKTIDDIS